MLMPTAIEQMDDDTVVQTEQHGNIFVLSMAARPHNLVSPDLMRGIVEGLQYAVKNGARAIILKSALRNFSAGADLALFESKNTAEEKDSGPKKQQPMLSAVDFLQAFENTPVPIIASLNGVCLGGGFEIALACDYIIAARSSRIGAVEATLGLHPILGGIQRQVERAGVLRAKEMSMLGRRYDPATMERWNLINHVVDDEELEKATMAIAQEFANGPTVAHAATKKLAYLASNEGVAAADAGMADIQKSIWKSSDLKEGLSSFMKRGLGLARFEGK